MTTLATVLRGLRSRALLSVAALAMMVLAVAGAVVGPMFQQAATTSYTLTRVAGASAPLTALTFRVEPRRGTDLVTLVDDAVDEAERLLPAPYAAPEVTLLTEPAIRSLDLAPVTYLARDDACSLLDVDGRCPEGPGEVLVNEDDLFSLAIGDTIVAPYLGTPEIVGTYRTPTSTDDWLLPARLGSRVGASGSYTPAPYVVTESVIADLPRRLWSPVLESRLQVPERLDEDDFDDLVTAVEGVRAATVGFDGGSLVGTSQVNDLGSVLVDVREQRDAARSAVAPAVVSLVLVALAMILRLQGAAADLRGPELALAALRGVGPRRSWVLGLSEPWLLVLLSLPLGLLGGYAGATALARTSLREGVEVGMPAASVAAAVLVVLVIAAVSAFAVGQGMRETLGARLAGVRRPARGARTGLVVELVVVFLATLLPLARLGSQAEGLGPGDLLLPVAVAVAAGLLVTRATGAAAGWWTRRGSGGPLSVFVASRALARRAQGTLVILPVSAALAISVFAVGVDSVAGGWRDSVAATTAPGDAVWSSPLTTEETTTLVRSADPEGRWAMTMAAVSAPDSGSLLLVDSTRLARVALWSPQWLDGGTAADAAALVAPPAPLLRLSGTEVALTVETVAPVTVAIDVHALAGKATLRLGPFPAGTTTLSTSTEDCGTGCELRSLALVDATGPARLSGLSADGSAVDLASSGWTTDVNPGETSTRAVVEDAVLVVEPGVVLEPAAVAEPLAVVQGVRAGATVVDDGDDTVVPVASEPVAVTVRARAESLPLVGPAGVMLDLASFLARYEPSPALVQNVVLVRADAPTSVDDALTRAGLTRGEGAAQTRQALDDSAYAQALRLYVVVGAVILLMALGGLLVSTAVQLPARRRDAASLRVVGVGRRTVVLASLWESVVVLGAATVAGLAAGLLAQVVLLRSLTLGLVDDGTTPRVLPEPDGARLLLLVGSVSLVLLLVAVLTSVAVVRRARAATLRESAR